MKKRILIPLEVLGLLCALITLYPFYLVLINSAKDAFSVTQNPMALPENFGYIWQNIINIWNNQNIRYTSSVFSSVFITMLSLLFLTFFSGQAAWVLVRTKTKTSTFIFFLFVAAMVVPFQIVMLPLVAFFRIIGDAIGVKLLRSYTGIILAYIGFGASLTLFLFHGFIKTIPYELEEAALLDGCPPINIFFRIVFPLLKPINATIIILNGIWIWNDYLLPLLILGKGGRVQTIPLAVANFAGAYVKQWDLILTAILMAMVPVIILFLVLQKNIVQGMTAGSIK